VLRRKDLSNIWRGCAAAVTLVVMTALACSPEAPPAPAPAPSASPERIVSLAPSVTEVVYDLGLGPKVVGVSDFAAWPPEVAKVERLGGLLDPNLEKLTVLRPDLVLLHVSAERVAEHTARLGIRTVSVRSETLDDIFASYRTIGAATGTEAEATRRVAALEAELARFRPREASGPRPKVLMVVGRNPGTLEGLVVVGRGVFLDELLERVGGQNALPPSVVAPWPQVNKESLLEADPAIIVELSPGGPTDAEAQRAALAPWGQLPGLKAVREGRVHMLTGDWLLLPGPRIGLTAKDLAVVVAGAP